MNHLFYFVNELVKYQARLKDNCHAWCIQQYAVIGIVILLWPEAHHKRWLCSGTTNKGSLWCPRAAKWSILQMQSLALRTQVLINCDWFLKSVLPVLFKYCICTTVISVRNGEDKIHMWAFIWTCASLDNRYSLTCGRRTWNQSEIST